MDKIACELLEMGETLLRNHRESQQVIVLRTAKGDTYSCFEGTDQEDALLNILRENNDTLISAMVSIWHNGNLDIPSLRLRKAVLNLNPRNAEAQIIVQTPVGISQKPLRKFF